MLYIVPTPIGNLRDITLRALDVLKDEADAILCEDTRHTSVLLRHYEIHKPLVSFHEHTGAAKRGQLLDRLRKGEKLALVSDAGTPVLSDPGFELVRECLQNGLPVECLPGPTSVTTALVASGLAPDRFSFFGFLPAKPSARRRALAVHAAKEETLIFFESPFRVRQALADMLAIFGDREAAVCRELTKKFEEVRRGRLSESASWFERGEPRGEFVLLVAGAGRKAVLA